MAKKNIHIFIFLALTALLPFLLYLTEGEVVVESDLAVTGDPAEADEEAEKINYYALAFTDRDEITFEAGQKIRPEPEPEPTPEPKPAPSNPGGGSSASHKEQQMINLVNEARKNAGLSELRVSSQLVTTARAKSRDMADNNYFSHQSPVYGDLAGLLKRFGISYRAAGENLAMNSNGSVSAAHNSLMGSAGHRSNILSNKYSHIGIGIAIRSDGTHYYTQLFIGH
jgi:uncharacterized YkwD family protein